LGRSAPGVGGEIAEDAHGGLQSDVDDVISGSSSVGISGQVAADNAEERLVGLRGWGDGSVEAHVFHKPARGDVSQGVDASNPREEDGLQVSSGIVLGGQRGEVCLEHLVDWGQEQGADDVGESRVADEPVEVTVLDGSSSVPRILVWETDEELVHQGISKARFLLVSSDISGSCVGSNNLVSISSEAIGGHLKNEGNNVQPSQDVVGRIIDNASREWIRSSTIDGDEVDQIEDFSDVDRERISSLSDEDSTIVLASWNVRIVDILSCVGGVGGEGLGSSIIPRLLEISYSRSCLCHSARTGNRTNGEAIIFQEVECCIVSSSDGSESLEGNEDVLMLSNQERETSSSFRGKRKLCRRKLVGDLESEFDFGMPIAGIIDKNGIEKIRVKCVVIGSAEGRMTRIKIGNEGGVARSARLVALEHVEIGDIRPR